MLLYAYFFPNDTDFWTKAFLKAVCCSMRVSKTPYDVIYHFWRPVGLVFVLCSSLFPCTVDSRHFAKSSLWFFLYLKNDCMVFKTIVHYNCNTNVIYFVNRFKAKLLLHKCIPTLFTFVRKLV